MAAISKAPQVTEAALRVSDLSVEMRIRQGAFLAVRSVSFDVKRGEILGVVGESGCGKSTAALAIMRLLPHAAHMVSGEVRLDGQDLMALSERQMRRVRGRDVAMIFQDPSSSLDPAFTIGSQLIEVVRTHRDATRAEARALAVEMLERVGMPHAARRLDDYPHQFSGGMRQRVMIAMALLLEPKVLIADEPTTALDVTTQAEILAMLEHWRETLQMSIVLITHDLAVVNEVADNVVVMYAGEIVEAQPAPDVFQRPAHPYTQGLLKSVPDMTPRGQPLAEIGGRVPELHALPPGCPFSPRCPNRIDKCVAVHPELLPRSDVARLRCFNPTPIDEVGR